MNCKNIRKRLVFDINTQEEKIRLHLTACPKCRAFKKQLEAFSSEMERLADRSLPAELAQHTYARCMAELQKSSRPASQPARRHGFAERVDAAALVSTLAVAATLVLIISQLSGESSMDFMPVLGIILQNTIMLLLAPLLLSKKNRFIPIYSKNKRFAQGRSG